MMAFSRRCFELAPRWFLLRLLLVLLVLAHTKGVDVNNAEPEVKQEKMANNSGVYVPGKIEDAEKPLLEFPLNLEYLEAEFFLWGGLGYGLDVVAPDIAAGGPPPKGAKMAMLNEEVKRIIVEFGFQEVGHLRAIKSTVPGFPRPRLDISKEAMAKTADAAFNTKLRPPFDPYANNINYLLASYLIPYVGLTGYVATIPNLSSATAKRLVAGLLAVESGQDGVIRALLYHHLNELVPGYPYTVSEFTDRFSNLRNKLSGGAILDEGLQVPFDLGAEHATTSNVLSADVKSVAYSRTPEQILGIVYGSGNASKPGGFYPDGARGQIAQSFLHRPSSYP